MNGSTPDISLEQLRHMMAANGVVQLLVKELSPNDNSKNQPYVARGNLDAINILPTGAFRVERTESGNETLKAPLDFYWLQGGGSIEPAPRTQVILYPQYPEIRLSGFLAGARRAPAHVMNTREPGRLLFLGVTGDRRIVAWASPADATLANQYLALGALERLGVFGVLPLAKQEEGLSTRDVLLREIKRIHELDWIDSKSLATNGAIRPCNSTHCVGYTLEAELGVARNGISEPDFRGWEVKATTVTKLTSPPSSKAITLMTPEPTGGFYRTEGVEAFIRKFGYADKLGRLDRKNFGGTFVAEKLHVGTQLTLKLIGFDVQNAKLQDPAGSLALTTTTGVVAAEWSFASLMSLWNRKHAQAIYVPAQAKIIPNRQYRYGRSVRLGIGTDFVKLLSALGSGDVYYDPGIKLENASSPNPQVKRRSQFRIKSNRLAMLYTRMEQVEV